LCCSATVAAGGVQCRPLRTGTGSIPVSPTSANAPSRSWEGAFDYRFRQQRGRLVACVSDLPLARRPSTSLVTSQLAANLVVEDRIRSSRSPDSRVWRYATVVCRTRSGDFASVGATDHRSGLCPLIRHGRWASRRQDVPAMTGGERAGNERTQPAIHSGSRRGTVGNGFGRACGCREPRHGPYQRVRGQPADLDARPEGGLSRPRCPRRRRGGTGPRGSGTVGSPARGRTLTPPAARRLGPAVSW